MIELVDKFRKTQDFHGLGRMYRIAVPAFSAACILWECPRWKGFLFTYVRDPFDDELATAIMKFVCRSWDGRALETGMLIISDRFDFHKTAMDTVILLGPPHRDLIGEIDPSLDNLKVVAFPAFRSEFSGKESVKLFETLIRARSDISNWGRPCRPQLWLYADGPQGSALISPVRKWVLTDLNVLRDEAERIAHAGGKFMLRNFAQELVSVFGGNGVLMLRYEPTREVCRCPSWSAATAILDPFVRENRWLITGGPGQRAESGDRDAKEG